MKKKDYEESLINGLNIALSRDVNLEWNERAFNFATYSEAVMDMACRDEQLSMKKFKKLRKFKNTLVEATIRQLARDSHKS